MKDCGLCGAPPSPPVSVQLMTRDEGLVRLAWYLSCGGCGVTTEPAGREEGGEMEAMRRWDLLQDRMEARRTEISHSGP